MGLGAILDFSIGNIISAVWSIVRWLGMLICSVIYGLVSWIYQVFMTLAQVNILTASDKIETIYERVTIILTIIMVFYITFQFVKYVVQPDTMTDKEKGAGNVIWRLILAIIMIAFVPTIFTKAYELQGRIINNQVIPKIILGKTDMDYNTLGSDFSADMMGMFLYVNEEACPTMEAPECVEAQKVVDEQLRQMRENKRFSVGSLGSVFFSGIKTNVNDEGEAVTLITYNGLLAIVVGCFILYVLVLYSIDLGTRYAQLIFLQVTAPIAIIGYVSPKKDGIFPKWLKQCLTTYLDLFIRLVLLYFILFIIGLLHDEIITGDLFKGVEDARKGLAYVALVMGLLAFAHKAPKMLKELFPSSGGAASIGFGLKSEDRDKAIKGTWNAGKRVVGGVAGAAVGVVGGIGAAGGLKAIKAMTGGKKASAIYSTLKAGTRGLKAGAAKQGGLRKGMQAARDSYQKDKDTREKNGDPLLADLGLAKQKGSNTPFNLRNASDMVKDYERETERYKTVRKSKSKVGDSIKDLKVRTFVDELKNTDAAKADAVLYDRLGGDLKNVEKKSRIYAMLKNNPQESDRALNDLRNAIKSAVIGTGVISNDQENALFLERVDLTKLGGAANIQEAIRNGTLKEEIVDSLKTTTVMTDEIKTIIKKNNSIRTQEEKDKIEQFLSSNENNQTVLESFIDSKIEKENAKWDTANVNLEEARDDAKDIGNVTIIIKRKDPNTGIETEGPVAIKDLTAEEFAREIGTIDDEAGKIISRREANKEYKTAKINTQVSGGSNK